MVHKAKGGWLPRKRSLVSDHFYVNGYRVSRVWLELRGEIARARHLQQQIRTGQLIHRWSWSRNSSSGLDSPTSQYSNHERLRRETDLRGGPGRQVGDVGLDVGSS